jgi:hypothetical protein
VVENDIKGEYSLAQDDYMSAGVYIYMCAEVLIDRWLVRSWSNKKKKKTTKVKRKSYTHITLM